VPSIPELPPTPSPLYPPIHPSTPILQNLGGQIKFSQFSGRESILQVESPGLGAAETGKW